jgi:hypothetical protein
MSIRLANAATATNGPPANVLASGTITAVAGSSLVDGETFTIFNRRGIKVTFEFDSNSSYTAGNVPVVFAGGDTNAQVATAIATAISGVASLGLSAAAVGAVVTSTARQPGAGWNAGVTETVANGTFAVTDITGGSLAGISLHGSQPGVPNAYWLKPWDSGEISGQSVAGSGVMTYQGRVWLMDPLTFGWHPAGIGTAAVPVADRGKLNDGNTIAEDGADNITFTQPINGLSAYGRIYLEHLTFGAGVATAMTVWLHPRAV